MASWSLLRPNPVSIRQNNSQGWRPGLTFQSASSQKGATSSRSSSEKWQKNRPESIDLENGYPSGSWFSFDSDLDERASHQSSHEHNSKSPKMIPLKSILRSVKSYTAIQPA